MSYKTTRWLKEVPQYTIEEDTNDLLYLHDGCIIGCSEDDSYVWIQIVL